MKAQNKRPLLITIVICLGFVLLEGSLAGGDVAEKYAVMRLPLYSPPLWVWLSIGAMYYVICFIVLYRLLRLSAKGWLRPVALCSVVLMMTINTAWNVLFFHTMDFQLAFFSMIPYNLVALALLVMLMKLDRGAAWAFFPYMLYLVYANVWGYGVWQINSGVGGHNIMSAGF